MDKNTKDLITDDKFRRERVDEFVENDIWGSKSSRKINKLF